MGLSARIYANQLDSYQQGIPLWIPEPVHNREVRIGDVGVVDENGQFQRFFNITVGAEHPYNKRGVPPGFGRLNLDAQMISVNPHMLHPGVFPSKSVKYSKNSISVAGCVNSYHTKVNGLRPDQCASQEPISGTGGTLSYTFECTESKGAMLLLTDYGQLSAIPSSSRLFKKYIARHFDHWLEFVAETLQLDQ